MREIKQEWCENFIRATFKKQGPKYDKISVGVFWKLAEKSGLWERGTYGTPMSKALDKLVDVETVWTDSGEYLCDAFCLKKGARG